METMEFRKIVVGTDFSQGAEVATSHAVATARQHGAEVVLVHVCPVAEHGNDSDWGQAMREELARNRERLEELRISLSGQGVTISHMVIDDDPDTGILRAASELGADLVVVGTHGRTGLKRLLLGSVAERVVRGGETNVLVARPAEHIAGGYRHILVPTDFSAPSRRALEAATKLVTRSGRIEVRHFWHTPVPGPIPTPTGMVKNKDATLSEQGAALIEPYRNLDFSISFMSSSGYAKEGILETLDTGDYDLVAMGSHGRRGPERWLLGSVTEALVRHAPCSVLVVKK